MPSDKPDLLEEEENTNEPPYVSARMPKRDSKPENPTPEGASQGTPSTRRVLLQVKTLQMYHGQMGRETAEELLNNKPAGTFFIRYSYKNPVPGKDGYLKNRDRVVLSLVLADGKTFKHAVIKSQCLSDVAECDESPTYEVFLTETPVKTFDNVTELIEHYTVSSLRGVNAEVFKKEDRLKYYITPEKPDQIIESTLVSAQG